MSVTPLRRFKYQRIHARQRGVEWLLTFEQWFAIWTESGHWHERGRTRGCYVMGRHGDVGPYAVGNVSIITTEQNVREANAIGTKYSTPRRRKDALPIGVYPNSKSSFRAMRYVGGKPKYLGTFATPELAHAAYLMAVPQPMQAAA